MKLKKTLALVLALVLAFGTLSVASAATDFTDDTSIQYKEEVDLMVGIGAINGLGDGTFNPKGSITRAQAAKMIAYTVLGEKVAKVLPMLPSSFSDVTSPDYDWAIPSIEYLVERGIINGIGGGKFAPDSPVTGYAFIKMLLVALGYGQLDEFTGTGWELEVHSAAIKTRGISPLWDGYIGSFDGLASATREEAALYCVNALFCLTVSFYDTLNLYLPDTLTLQAPIYNLYTEHTANDIGLWGHKWYADKLGKDAISDFYVDDEFVINIPMGTAFKDVPKLLGTTADANKRDVLSYDNGVLDESWYTDGWANPSELKTLAGTDAKVPTSIDVYISADATDIADATNEGVAPYKFMATYEYFAQITTKTNATTGKAKMTIYDPTGAGDAFDVTGTYAKGDAFVVVPKGNDIDSSEDNLLSMEPATVITGKASSAATDSTYVTVNGTKYTRTLETYSDATERDNYWDFTKDDAKTKDAEYILDSNGDLLTAVALESQKSPIHYGYAVGYGYQAKNILTGDAVERVEFYDETGTKVTMETTLTSDGANVSTEMFAAFDPTDGLTGTFLIAYTLNADGTKISSLIKEVLLDTDYSDAPVPDVGTKNVVDGDQTITDNTVVFYVSSDGDTVAATVGYSKFVSVDEAAELDVIDLTDGEDLADKKLEAIVIKCKAGLPDKLSPKTAGFVYFASLASYTSFDDTTTYTNAYVDGVKTEFVVKTGDKDNETVPANIVAGGTYSYKPVAGKTYFDVDKKLTVGTAGEGTEITQSIGGLITAGEDYSVTASTVYYYMAAGGSIYEVDDMPAEGDNLLAAVPGDDGNSAAIIYVTPSAS
ncbi:MAG: S-layer homology domain-containing protein [Oscillospiraceae bacterium]|jgi:hypothetical protein|nr:S-layer homology domain-containing protein [Oscillospiraceae bacterium]